MNPTSQRAPITTHVLDIHRGKPGAGIQVRLEHLENNGQWTTLKLSSTDIDGRIGDLLPPGTKAKPGTYRLAFETKPYFDALSTRSFYPDVAVTFIVEDPDQHYHVPLLLSAHGYSTYRGT